jgi:hypothetical protein
MENSAFVTDTELDKYINDALKELFELLVVTYGQEYFYTVTTFNTISGRQSYEMPDDAFKLLRVDVKTSDGYEPLRPWKFPATTLGATTTARRRPGRLPRYRWLGSELSFEPEPEGTHWFRVHYVPRPSRLDDDTDELPRSLDDWAEFIVLKAGIKCLAKEESDASELTNELTMLRAHIVTSAPDKDAGYPQTVVDDRNRYDDGDECDVGGWTAATSETVIELPFECAKIRSKTAQSVPNAGASFTTVTLGATEFNNSTSMETVDTGDIVLFIQTNSISVRKAGYYLIEWESTWESGNGHKESEPTFDGASPIVTSTKLVLAGTELSGSKAILMKIETPPVEIGLQAYQSTGGPINVNSALAASRLGDV